MVNFRDQTDSGTFSDVEAGFHRPLVELEDPRVIIDLGCHAGFTILDFLALYPNCHVYAAELDYGNFETARMNIHSSRRVTLINVGIANWEGTCYYEGTASNNFKIIGPADHGRRSPCITLDKYIAMYVGDKVIDYAKFDIEGMERNIFRSDGWWPKQIANIGVEVHDDYTVDMATEDLQAHGYKVERNPLHEYALFASKRIKK